AGPVRPLKWKMNRRVRGCGLSHSKEGRLQPVIRVPRVKHAVEHAEAGANRGFMVRGRIPSQTDSRVKVPERRIDGRGLFDGYPLPERRINEVELLVAHRPASTRGRVAQTGVQREYSSEFPSIVDVRRVSPVPIVS